METMPVLEPQQNQTNGKLKLPFIQAGNASELGKLGAKRKKEQDIALKQALAHAQAELEILRPLVQQSVATTGVAPNQTEDYYRITELARTRKGLEGLWRDFDATNDPKERKFLADAIARLSDVEFDLSGRAKAGTRRPGREKSERSTGTSAPID